MDVNKLRHRVTIEENQGTVNDGGGNKTPNWVGIATTWAEVKPTNGTETTKADKVSEEISHIVKMRYRANLTKANHRINFNGRILAIEYIINVDERNIELNLYCREG